MATTRGGIHGDEKAQAQAQAEGQSEVLAEAAERVQAALASASIAGVHIESKPIAELIPAAYNPRKIEPEELAGLKSSIRRFGLVEPIVWNRQTEHVVGGHQRLKALAALGVTDVPVVVVDISLAEERALNIALNNPAIQGQFDDKVHEILDEIRTQDPIAYDELRIDALSDVLTFGEEVPEPKGSRPTRTEDRRPSPDLEPESSSRSLRLTFTHNDFAFVKRALRRLAGVYADDNASAIVHAALREALDRHSPPE
jgi:hypothetical protein